MQCQVQEVLRGKVVKETQKLSLTIISSKALIDFTISNAKIFTYILILVLGSTSVRYVVYVSDWNIPSLNLFYHQWLEGKHGAGIVFCSVGYHCCGNVLQFSIFLIVHYEGVHRRLCLGKNKLKSSSRMYRYVYKTSLSSKTLLPGLFFL